MLQNAIYDCLRVAKVARQRVVHDPIPVFDQLTQYVYQSGVEESRDGLRVRVAVGTVAEAQTLRQAWADANTVLDAKPADWVSEASE